jgi:flagellar hook-length control protein FliK
VSRLADQIASRALAKTTQFDIALEPAGLGKVDVHLRIAHDGALTAALSFDQPAAAAELKSRASELQQALQQAGFDLADGALSFDVASQGGQERGAQAHLFDSWRERTLRAFAALDEVASPSAFSHRPAGPGLDLVI